MGEPTDVYRARQDASEQLTYALLGGDTDRIAAARIAVNAAIDRADEMAAGTPSAAVRRATADQDPVTAATLGWLSMADLDSRVQQNPAAFLDEREVDDYAKHGAAVLRIVVRSRYLGVPYDTVANKVLSEDRAEYLLAARGEVSDLDGLRSLLQSEGLWPDGHGGDSDRPPSPPS